MAEVSVVLEVQGAGSVTLPVTFSVPTPVSVGVDPVEVTFSVQNTLGRGVVFPSLDLAKEGPQADKLGVTLVSNAMTLAIDETQDNVLVLTPNEPLVEGDSVTVTVTGAEG